MAIAKSQGGSDAMDGGAQVVLDCGQKMLAILKQRDDLLPLHETQLRTMLLTTVPSLPAPTVAANVLGFGTLGAQLWNGATNLLRDNRDTNPTTARIVALLRAFAFHLISISQLLAARRSAQSVPQPQTLNLGLKAARLALKQGENVLAEQIFVQCAELVRQAEELQPEIRLAASKDNASNTAAAFRLLTVEYYLLRAALAWQTQQLDLADLFYNKAGLDQVSLTAEMAEKAADLFHDAAKTLASNKQDEAATSWCQRGLAVLAKCEDEEMHDIPDLRLAISATCIKACMRSANATNLAKATAILDDLETTYGLGNRVAVALMRLDVICADPQVDARAVRDTMARMMRLSSLTETTFTTFMQAIHRVKRVDTSYALDAIRDLLSTRLLPDLDVTQIQEPCNATPIDRVEKCVVTYVLFATTGSDERASHDIGDLQTVFDLVLSKTKSALSVKAAHAAQTLIWKVAGHPGVQQPMAWCRLLQHELFDNVGQINKTRIARKMLTIALVHNDGETARTVFLAMSPNAQSEPLSRYLAFKIALQCNNLDFAVESLRGIIAQAGSDHVYLYACVLDAQRSSMEHVAVLAMQALIDRQASGVHLPAMLRCTLGLLVRRLDSKGTRDNMIEPIVQIFENAGNNVQILQQGDTVQRQHEIEWWSKSAFNFALRICGDCKPQDLIRMLRACTHLFDGHHTSASSAQSYDVLKRKALCHFLSATALIVLGRSEEDAQTHYSDARLEIAKHMNLIQELGRDAQLDGKTLARAFEALKFDLECILMLGRWDHLDNALQALLTFQGADNWASLLDITLILHDRATHLNVEPNLISRIPELLQKCINETWNKDKDIVQMSRWLRLTFLIHISDRTKEGQAFALKIVQQAATIAEKRHGRAPEQIYPEAELQYLAAVTFNQAIDLLATGKEAEADTYIDAALDLARWADDNGALHANLTSKREAAAARRKQGVI